MKIISTLISVAALSAITSSAWAAGTTAGTSVDNTASISYTIGSTPQTDIYSSPTGNSIPGEPGVDAGAPTVADTTTAFVVDKKIDLSITAGSPLTVTPGTTGVVDGANQITYTVTNEGNSPEYFDLDLTQVTGEDFDATACSIAAPTTVPTLIAADGTTTVKVICDIPDSTVVSNGETADIDLRATAVTDATGAVIYAESAADTAGVDVVLADDTGSATDAAIAGGDRNASHSAVNTYTVNTASLIVQKTSAVTKMSINGADDTTNPMHIPGSTIEYTITVSNGVGASLASGLVISDILPTELTYVGCTLTGAGTATCSNVAGTVTSTAFDLAASGTATLVIEATVN